MDVALPDATAFAFGADASVPVAGLPVRVEGVASVNAPRRVKIESLGRVQAASAGVEGVLLRVSRSDGIAGPGPARFNVDYSAFRWAYGGDWASRLSLWVLPECALSSPMPTLALLRHNHRFILKEHAMKIPLSSCLFSAFAVTGCMNLGNATSGNMPGGTSSSVSALSLPAGYSVKGIDISSHQHPNGASFDWSTQAAAGTRFAYIKATEGLSYVNPYFDNDDSVAKSLGLYVGAYAFARPDQGDPAGQADYLVDNANWVHDGWTLPPLVDMEWPYKSDSGTYVAPYPCYGLSASQMVSWIASFLSEVKARTGVTPMVYTNANWWDPCTGSSSSFGNYLLDISTCNDTPPSVPGWGTNWTFWQYDIDACGDGATLDYDVYQSSLAEMASLAAGGRAAPTGALGLVQSGNGILAQYRLGSDGWIWGANQTAVGSAFGSWVHIGDHGGFAGKPTALIGRNHTIVVYARGTDNKMYGVGQPSPGAAFGNWVSIGSGQPTFSSEPTVVLTPSGLIAAYATATDGHVWGSQQSTPGGAFGTWGQIGTSDGGVVSQPQAIIGGNGTIIIYARTSTGIIRGVGQSSPGAAFGTWITIGSGQPTFSTAPSAVLTPGGKIAVYATATDGHVWGSGQSSSGGSFGTWVQIGTSGGGIASRPQPLVGFNGTIAIYARTNVGTISGVGQSSPGAAFGTWQSIGTSQPSFVGDPSAMMTATGAVVIYDAATDGWIWGSGQASPGSTFGSWIRIGS